MIAYKIVTLNTKNTAEEDVVNGPSVVDGSEDKNTYVGYDLNGDKDEWPEEVDDV